jgi:hypothetical protein
MEIKDKNYYIAYDPTDFSITFRGALRLRTASEYAPILQLLDQIVAAEPATITLDLRDLHFINSSGLNMLFRFILDVREQMISRVIVRGADQVPWQIKAIKTMRQLLPGGLQSSLE